ncbi:hypothetical protein M8J77_009877 [Diaphorina citri]|nr:hypothetical protein M8J77_009877 [Diaphorina citri]
MEKSNEKSVYELLAMTASDSSTLSDVPDIVFRTEPVVPQQKKRRRRLKRHQRNQMSTHTTCDEDELILQGPPKSSRFCIYLNQPVVYCFGIAVILSWLIALTLLLLSFHSDLHGLDHSVSTVQSSSHSSGRPDKINSERARAMATPPPPLIPREPSPSVRVGGTIVPSPVPLARPS